MSHLIEVAFKGNRKEFFLWDGDDPPRMQSAVIVEGDRGEDLGHVHAHGEAAGVRFAGVAHGAIVYGGGSAAQPQKRALRLASDDEVQRASDLPEQNESARRRSIERVKAHGLVMKVSDAEWQWDRRKLTLYFTAEKRVDFRSLVRDLAALFRTRIELKQIGVRDEAKRLNGVGRCGREYCSASWLPELRPVNLSVAKDQHLSLNPTQISGACGRLMCSLRYEHEFYVQSRKRFPKEGKVLATARGEEKVVANDIFRDRVTLRALDGEFRVVPLAELRDELAGLAADREPFVRGDEVTGIDDGDDGTAATNRDSDPSDAALADRRQIERRRAQLDAVEAPPLPAPLADPVTVSVAATPESLEPEPGTDDDEDDGEDDPAGDVSRDAADAADAAAADAAAADAAADVAADASGTPRPRRRRGRRGGRRGRGASDGTSAPPAPPPPPDASA